MQPSGAVIHRRMTSSIPQRIRSRYLRITMATEGYRSPGYALDRGEKSEASSIVHSMHVHLIASMLEWEPGRMGLDRSAKGEEALSMSTSVVFPRIIYFHFSLLRLARRTGWASFPSAGLCAGYISFALFLLRASRDVRSFALPVALFFWLPCLGFCEFE